MKKTRDPAIGRTVAFLPSGEGVEAAGVAALDFGDDFVIDTVGIDYVQNFGDPPGTVTVLRLCGGIGGVALADSLSGIPVASHHCLGGLSPFM